MTEWTVYGVAWLVGVGIIFFVFWWALIFVIGPDPRDRRPTGPPPPHVNPEPGHARKIRLD